MSARWRGRRDEHEEYRLLAAAAVDGRLDPDSATALDAHLATCEACRIDQAAMLADHALLAHPAAASWPTSRVLTYVLEAARAPRIPRTSDRPRSLVPLVAAGVVLAVVGAVALGFRGFGPTVGSGPSIVGPGVLPGGSIVVRPSVTPVPLARTVPAGACAPHIRDLTAWWPGEPDGRDIVADHVAAFRGDARTAPGLVGSAFDFDGRTAYAEVAGDPSLTLGTADFTMMLWVRFDDTSGERVLIEQWLDKGGGAPRTAGWTLTKLADDVLLFTSEADGKAQGTSTQALAFEAGTWYHVGVRRSGADIAIMVNDTGTWSTRNPAVIDIAVDRPLLLGRRGDDRGYLLDGQLDEIKLVVGRAIFESDIRADYLAGSTGTCPA